MAFYGTAVDNKIKNINYLHNQLEDYDNVTYNARFYMISQEYQNQLSKERLQNDKNIVIQNKYKVIIAETGVTTQYSIDEISLKSVFSQVGSQNNSLTYEIKMQLKEINDCTLINKITLVSKLLGYESYTNRPYHLDIWFSGYKHDAPKNPIAVIGEVYTFEVIASEVKSNVNDQGTIYSFLLTPTNNIAYNKDLDVIMNSGEFKSMSGTVEDLRKNIENKVNELYFKNNPQYKKYYSDGKYIEINLINNINGSQSNGKITSLTDKNSSPKYTNSTSAIQIKPDNTTTLNTIFQDICAASSDLRNVLARPYYQVSSIGSYENQEMYKIKMNVVLTKAPYLEWFQKHAKEIKERGTLTDVSPQELETMQLALLEKMENEKTLQKRYQFMFNGVDTNVLEMNSTLDNLWFMNLGGADLHDVATSSKALLQKMDELENKEISSLNSKTNDYNFNDYSDIDRVRSLAADGRLYLDDIYNTLSKTVKINLLSSRKVLEKSDLYSPNSVENMESNDEAFEQTIAKVGFTNLFGKANLVELKIRILGDPYWIRIPSDNALYGTSMFPDNVKLFNFIYTMRTGMKTDGYTTTGYNLEDVAEITGVYQVVGVTSMFRDGKFTQELQGVINGEFLASSLIKV